MVGQAGGGQRGLCLLSLCPSVCCWRCSSRGPVARDKDEPGELKFRPVQVLLLLKQSYLFFFCQIPLKAEYLHISRKGKTTGHTGVNRFWKWQTAFENKRMSPYRKKKIIKKKSYFKCSCKRPLFSYFIFLKRRAQFCGVTLKSRTHTHTQNKKTFPFCSYQGMCCYNI